MPYNGPFFGYVPREISGSDSNSDPRASKTIGYRSGAGRLPQPKQSYAGGTFQRIMYNDWWFPPTCSIKTTFVPEYTTAGTALKYVTLAVTVEAIITPGDIGGPESVLNTDYTMDILRQRLLTPRQEFHLVGNGFGNIIINDPDEPSSQWDVDFGPKPQVLDWEPLAGGMACRVQWLCATRIPRCTLLYDDLDLATEDEDPLAHAVLDLEWSADWNYGEDGFLVMQVNGKVQIHGASIGFVDDNNIRARNIRNGYMAQLELVKERLLRLFPQKEGFKRSVQYQLSTTANVLNFTFTDTEIKSPQGYPEGAIQFDIQESLSSAVDKGFNTWDWRLSGEISVPKVLFKEELNPGTNVSMVNNKQLCYTAFYKVLLDRLNRIKQVANQNKQDRPIDLKTLENPQGEQLPQKLLYFIPNKINMTNEIFGNSLSIDLVYTIVCPSNLIMAASGMFDQVRVPGFTWPEWLEWLIAAKVLPDSVRGTLPERDYVVDICSGVPETELWNYEQAREDGKITGNGIPEDYAVNGDKTYLEYTNKFEVETYHSVSFAAKLLSGTSPVGETSAILQNRKNTFTALSDFDLSENLTAPPAVSPKENPLLLSSSGNPVTIVRMIGRATRIGAPVNPPKLISVDGQPAIRFGKDTVMTESKTMGGMLVDLEYPEQLAYNPETNPNIRSLYRTTWEKTYIINGVPSVAQLETTGKPEYYM